ncbi:MAG: CpsD/CapB family tyrosine-protein kinase [Deltaproteobacteria bacterium]|nr:CpsD/CapB family tyrosine-protein kinase [Deltaproteobacteria bacterium]
MKISKALEKQNKVRPVAGMTGKLDDHLYMYHMPYSYTAEQIRKIRTQIFHLSDRPIPRVIMVTSSVPAEGKTIVASNLAISIAKSEERHVLLIECDMRRPSLYRVFSFPRSPGLSEIIQGKASIEDCLVKTPIDKFAILPAAEVPPSNPSELLESRKMASIIKEVAMRYNDRFIILDTPPIQATVDPKIISGQADGIIVVARYRYIKRADFEAALENLPRDKIIGTVLNAVDDIPAIKYKYKKYKYDKYY